MDQSPTRNVLLVICFCLSAFLGAFLLFQIEPIVGKLVTPRYGGTASVWTICLLFFQSVVLAGYAFTYFVTRLPARFQIILYLSVFAVSLLWSQIPADLPWAQGGTDDPALSLLIVLATRVAVPCILLSTVSGVMQVWFGLSRLGNPYPLYSVSNLGSIAALLAYPTLIEPNFTIALTLHWWFWFYCILALSAILCATIVWFKSKGHVEETNGLDSSDTKEAGHTATSFREFAVWTFFSTMGSATLLSYTSYITSDVAPTPLLWVLPLTIYLLTFVLVFGNSRYYRQKLFLNTWMLLCAAEPFCMRFSYLLGLVINLLLVFEICMICHGELAARKPDVARLPIFYLAVATGGALGGVLIGIVAPAIFNFEAERFFIIVIMGVFTVYHLAIKKFQATGRGTAVNILVGVVAVATLVAWLKLTPDNLVYRERNFYSAARVVKEGDYMVFYHGRVNHGQQYLDPGKAGYPAGFYYGVPLALVANFVHSMRASAPVSFAGVGLGAGTFAVYGRPQDTMTFYELDPKVKRIAEKFFTYLSHCQAKASVLIGDGRTLLNAQPPQNYDLLLVDAFNGDAIPCHLLTKEAILIDLKHLKPDGFLLFHTTNRFLDLAPVLGNVAHALNLSAYSIRYVDAVTYVVMCRNSADMDKLVHFAKEHQATYPNIEIYPTPLSTRIGVWTDDFTNLLGVLKR